MEFLIRAALILDSNSPHHNSHKDLLIRDGIITKISDKIVFEGDIVEANGLRVSPGWMDMRAHYSDPGMEHKEDLDTGSATAAAGGFTDVLLMPNTLPAVDNKNAVSHYAKWSRNSAVRLHVAGAITRGCEGKELTDMIDLHHAGAKAFTEGVAPVWHTNIMLKTLQYLQKFDGVLINRPEDQMLTAFGVMHEGEVSTRLGMKGMPSISEEVMIQRDLRLLEYTGGKVHFSLISTKGSVELIRDAKARGLNVTVDVGVHHLVFQDGALKSYDTNLKVNPPFRLASDRDALVAGVLDGTIDVIVSDHQPQDQESKKLEFDLAEFGIIGQQSFYSTLCSVFGEKTDEILEKVFLGPRSILGMNSECIKESANACLTLFSPELDWDYNKTSNTSKSDASPFLGKKLKGCVVGIVNGSERLLNTYEN